MKAWVGGRLDALRGCGAERGSAAVEAAILTPALVMLVCLALAMRPDSPGGQRSGRGGQISIAGRIHLP